MKTHLIAIALGLSAAMGAQTELDTNTLVVTARRSGESRIDSAGLYLSYRSAPETGLDEVLARLAGSGVEVDDLDHVYTSTEYTGDAYVRYAEWNFRLTTPIDRLTALQQTLARIAAAATWEGAPALRWQVFGARATYAATDAASCPWATLLDDARRQAARFAAAAGRSVGGVLSLASQNVVVAYVGGSSPNDEYMPPPQVIYGGVGTTEVSPSCVLTVQFRLLP